MKSLLTSVILATCLSVALSASIPSHQSDADNLVDAESDSRPEDLSRLSWLRYLLQNQQTTEEEPQPHNGAPQKRFSSFGMPYIKYRVDKRNNGVWIWMPAQGYVSVPKQQQALSVDASAKQGKIMRYGK